MVRIALASPSSLVRAGLAAGLRAQGGFDVVLTAASVDELREAGFAGADAAVVDVGAEGDDESESDLAFLASRNRYAPPADGSRGRPNVSDAIGGTSDSFAGAGSHAGADAAGDATAGSRAPALVVLAADADERIGEWLIDGCSVLPRSASVEAIAGAVHAALAGLVATPAHFAAEALRFERIGERRPSLPGVDALTRRERQVLAAMSRGLANREIGVALGISAHTAKFHVAQIIAKLQVQSRAHAVAQALRAGLFIDA